MVRLTPRGWAAFGVIRQTMERLEAEWSQALGQDVYAGLALALLRLEQVLDEVVAAGR